MKNTPFFAMVGILVAAPLAAQEVAPAKENVPLSAAQQAVQPASPQPVFTPATSAVPASKIAALPTPVATIPSLPPSDPCKPQEVAGIWRLAQVYESPAASELAAFSASPVQYIFFKNDATFARYNAGAVQAPLADVVKQMNAYEGPLLQYVVQNGMIYSYQDQKLNDTQACFIVKRAQGMFATGELLLMPPKGQIEGRLVKVYKRPTSSTAAPSSPATNAQRIQSARAQQLRQQKLRQQQLRQQQLRQQQLQQRQR